MKSLLKLTAVLAIGVWLVAGNTYPAAASAEEADNQSSQPEAVMQVADAYMAKGESLLRAGKPEEALPHFDKAIEQNPDSAIAYNYRAICHAMTKNLRQALEDAETAIYIDYYYTSAHLNLASLFRSVGALEDAIDQFEQLNRMDDEHFVKSSGFFSDWAQLYMEAGNWDEANRLLDKALEINDKNGDAYFLRGQLLETRDYNYQGAIEQYTRALEVAGEGTNTAKWLILKDRGFAHYILNENAAALADISAAMGILADYDGYVIRGAINMRLNDYGAALKDFEQAARMKPDQATPVHNMGLVYLNQQKYGKAMDMFKKALKIDPEFALSHMNMAMAYREEGKLKKAMECVEKALELEPSNEAFLKYRDEIEDEMKN